MGGHDCGGEGLRLVVLVGCHLPRKRGVEGAAAAWVGENPDYVNVRAEIIDGETVRIFFVDPEDEDREEQTEDLDAEDVARLFGSDNCGEIDEDEQTVETWRE